MLIVKDEDHAELMKITLTAEQKIALEIQHRQNRDRRVCDRIRCVLLCAEVWSPAMIAQSQRIDETTVRRHLNDWLNEKKLEPKTEVLKAILTSSRQQNSPRI